MLSILACYSLYAAIPVYVCLAGFDLEGRLTKARAKCRPRLWVIVVLLTLLAIDGADTRARDDAGTWNG